MQKRITTLLLLLLGTASLAIAQSDDSSIEAQVKDLVVKLNRLQKRLIKAEQEVQKAEQRVEKAEQQVQNLQNLLASKVEVPIGTIIPYAGNNENIPNDWLLCNGSYVPFNQYRELFDVIGQQYGKAENGKFCLPNLRGRFVMGVKSEQVGEIGGSALNNHIHRVTANTTGAVYSGGETFLRDAKTLGRERHIGHYHQIVTNTGSPSDANNLPPYITLLYLIKAK